MTRRLRCSDLLRDPTDGLLSISKVWTHVGCSALVTAFVVQARTRDVTFESFVGFAVSMLLMTGSPLAAKIIGMKWGRGANGNGDAQAPKGNG